MVNATSTFLNIFNQLWKSSSLFAVQLTVIPCAEGSLHVRPLLEYASQVWSPHIATEIAKVESAQIIH